MGLSITPDEHQQILAAIDELESRDPEGLKEIFCECWPCTEKLLNFLKKYLPAPIPAIVDKLIEYGNRIHKMCPAKP